MKTIGVIGGRGFIGTALCRELKKNSWVISIDRSRTNKLEDGVLYVQADISKPEASLKEALSRCDVVYHLAAIDDRVICQKDLKQTFKINAMGTAYVLEMCSHVDHFVYMSSNMVYGEVSTLPISEDFPVNSKEPYAVSKIASEHFCNSYSFMKKIPITIVRNFNTYGPGQSKASLIPSIILEGMTKEQIEVWSSGTLRDFLYVDDCASALAKIFRNPEAIGQTLNLGSGIGTTTGELVELVAKMLNTKWVDLKKPLPIGARFICDNSKVKALLNWTPETTLEQGLQKTIQYYRNA